MPRPTSEAGDAVASVSEEEIPALVGGLRAAFNTDKTRSKAWRLAQLAAFDRLITEGRDELCDVSHFPVLFTEGVKINVLFRLFMVTWVKASLMPFGRKLR